MPDPAVEALSLLRELVVEQVQQREMLAAILRVLERSHGARDAADAALLVAIVEAIGERPFTSGELLAHARAVAPALLAALEAADISTAQEFGCVCRRMDGMAVHGLRLARVDDRTPVRWRVEVCEG